MPDPTSPFDTSPVLDASLPEVDPTKVAQAEGEPAEPVADPPAEEGDGETGDEGEGVEAAAEGEGEEAPEGEGEPPAGKPVVAKFLDIEGVTADDAKALFASLGVKDKATFNEVVARGGRLSSHFQSIIHKKSAQLSESVKTYEARLKTLDAEVEQKAISRAAELAKTYSEIPPYPGADAAEGLDEAQWAQYHRLQNKTKASDPVYQQLQKLLAAGETERKQKEEATKYQKMESEFAALDQAAFASAGMANVPGSAPTESTAIPPEAHGIPPMLRYLVIAHIRAQVGAAYNHANAVGDIALRPTPDAVREETVVALREVRKWLEDNYVPKTKPTGVTPGKKPDPNPRSPHLTAPRQVNKNGRARDPFASAQKLSDL